MDMRKALSILFMIIALLPLSAAYSVVTPASPDGEYMLLNAIGETLPLDDNLYYKEWSGLLAEQLNTGIYKIRENERSAIVVTKPYSMDLLRYALWSQMDITTLIVPALPDIEPSELADSAISEIVTFSRASELDERLYSIQGIEVHTVEPGYIVDIHDGKPLIDEGRQIHAVCPHCGETFVITI